MPKSYKVGFPSGGGYVLISTIIKLNCIALGMSYTKMHFFTARHPRWVLYDQYVYVELYNYIVIHNSEIIRSISCISIYMSRLVYTAIFRLVFRVDCMYNFLWTTSRSAVTLLGH
jgi:hypothetical protein